MENSPIRKMRSAKNAVMWHPGEKHKHLSSIWMDFQRQKESGGRNLSILGENFFNNFKIKIF